jgi:hypothetical protein
MILIFAIGAYIAAYLLEELSVARWVATYATPLPPVDISSLDVLDDEACEPLVTCIPRGRPKKERVQGEDVRRPVDGVSSVITVGYCRWVLLWQLCPTASVAAVAHAASQGTTPCVCRRPHQ